jgi:hypothetical protein
VVEMGMSYEKMLEICLLFFGKYGTDRTGIQ